MFRGAALRDFLSAIRLAPFCLSVAAMLAVSHATAQTPGFNGALVILQRPQFDAKESGCPVFMRASQRSAARVFKAGSIVPAPGQGLTLTLTEFKSLRITSAEIVVHGLSPKDRAVLTSIEDDADVARPFHLTAKESGEFSGELWMKGVTAIRWIEVKSLTYSNGSVWRASETRKCVVRPDPFILISSAR